ncbi:MAG TPA: hypothetical protein DCL35_07545 [Candidatus Omnitrophica bacterium]|nr:hypothetical protein [Candidatus Omnitrophota bacterium]
MVSIVYPMDPVCPKAGGVQANILEFIKFSPPDLDISLVGLTGDKGMPVKKWHRLKAGSKDFDFLPVMFERDLDRRKLVPLSLRFVLSLALSHIDLSGRVLFFHRFEPALLFKRLKGPKILMVHNDVEEQILGKKSEVLWSRLSFFYFMLEKYVFGDMAHIYSVTERTERFYRARYPALADRFSFLPTWVDHDRFTISQEPRLSLRRRLCARHEDIDPDKKWVLFAGRLQRQKAPLRLIDVFSQYHKKNTGSCLIIAGDGNVRLDMERYAGSFGLTGSVFFLGTLAQEELIDLYRASDALLLVSFFEGMPRCVLEAMDCGLPVVATDVGEVGRVVKNGFSGEAVKDVSIEALVSALEKVLNDPQGYKKENCISIARDYTPERVLRPVYELIRTL